MATISPVGSEPTTTADMHFANGAGAELIQPDAGLRDGDGYVYDQKPKHTNFNWFFNRIGQWIGYISTNITNIYSELTNHDDRIVTNEGDIGTIETRVTATEGDITTIENSMMDSWTNIPSYTSESHNAGLTLLGGSSGNDGAYDIYFTKLKKVLFLQLSLNFVTQNGLPPVAPGTMIFEFLLENANMPYAGTLQDEYQLLMFVGQDMLTPFKVHCQGTTGGIVVMISTVGQLLQNQEYNGKLNLVVKCT